MKQHHLCIRKTYSPLISNLPPYRELSSADPARLTVATHTSNSVICLPIYPELEKEHLDFFIDIIQQQ